LHKKMIQLPQEMWDNILAHKTMDAEFRAQRKLKISRIINRQRRRNTPQHFVMLGDGNKSYSYWRQQIYLGQFEIIFRTDLGLDTANKRRLRPLFWEFYLRKNGVIIAFKRECRRYQSPKEFEYMIEAIDNSQR